MIDNRPVARIFSEGPGGGEIFMRRIFGAKSSSLATGLIDSPNYK